MNLEVGMYVRYKGKIGKYIQPDLGKPYITNSISFDEGANYGDYSYNIIDLIEVGDYVNGEIVKSLPLTKCVDGIKKDTWRIANCTNEDIKSIVTKEQFESVSYKVG